MHGTIDLSLVLKLMSRTATMHVANRDGETETGDGKAKT